jgi:hypothetical protein
MNMDQPDFRSLMVPVDHYPNPPSAADGAWAVWRYVDKRYQKVGYVVKLSATIWQAVNISDTTKRWDGKAKSRVRAIEAAIAAGVF